jgi:hypothetical protein
LGDGANVWKKPWLHDEVQAYITTTAVEEGEDMKVADLINQTP